METKLRVSTKAKAQKSDEEFEPMSPLTEYLLTESFTLFVLCFFESELPLDVSTIHDFLNNDFVNVHPRLSSIPVEDKRGKKKWKRVEVNVEDHVKIPVFTEGLSAEEYSKHFDEYTSNLASSQIAQDKPLWEVHIFNYPTNNYSAGTVIVKFHHSIADGISLMSIIFSCSQRADDPSTPLTFPTRKTISKEKQSDNVLQTMMKGLNIVPKFMASIFNSFHEFARALRFIYSEDDRTPIRSGRIDDHPQFKLCTVTLSLNDIKRIKTILGVTVNDVVVGILILGVRLYMQEIHHGEIKKTRSTALITLNIRKAKGYALPEEMRKDSTKVPWGNRVSTIEIPIPNLNDGDLTDPLKFIMEAHNVIKRKINTPFAQILLDCYIGAVRTCGGISAAAEIFERRLGNPSLVLSNLIGPIEKMSLASHPINAFYFIPTGAKTSLTVSVMSYMEKLTIGLAVEKCFIDDQGLSRCLEKGFQMIFQAATTTSNSAAKYADALVKYKKS